MPLLQQSSSIFRKTAKASRTGPPKREFLTSQRLGKEECKIRVANGHEVDAEDIITLSSLLNINFILRLNNVLYVLSMTRNLISVFMLDDRWI